MSTTSIDICAHALVMIGAQPITSFEDGSTESVVARNLYETTMRDLLSQHRWRFCTNQVNLSRLSDAPSARWDAAYQLPNNLLLIETVTLNGSSIDYDRYEDMIFCNLSEEDSPVLDGTFWVDEQFWPSYFVAAAEIKMAALFALSVANQVQTADYLEKLHLRRLAGARHIDSNSQTSKKLDMGGLVRGRYRGGRS